MQYCYTHPYWTKKLKIYTREEGTKTMGTENYSCVVHDKVFMYTLIVQPSIINYTPESTDKIIVSHSNSLFLFNKIAVAVAK